MNRETNTPLRHLYLLSDGMSGDSWDTMDQRPSRRATGSDSVLFRRLDPARRMCVEGDNTLGKLEMGPFDLYR